MHIAVVTTKLIHILLQIKWALEAGYYVMVWMEVPRSVSESWWWEMVKFWSLIAQTRY